MDSLASTSATVECTVTGITTELAGLKWYDSSGGELTDTSLYTITNGSLVGDIQTTTLTVTAGVTADTTYKCEIHGTKYDASINVYSKLIQTFMVLFTQQINTVSPYSLICS